MQNHDDQKVDVSDSFELIEQPENWESDAPIFSGPDIVRTEATSTVFSEFHSLPAASSLASLFSGATAFFLLGIVETVLAARRQA